MRLLIGIFLSLCLPLSASAGIYKWVDNHGRTHYSQLAPKNQKAKSIKMPKFKKPVEKIASSKEPSAKLKKKNVEESPLNQPKHAPPKK